MTLSSWYTMYCLWIGFKMPDLVAEWRSVSVLRQARVCVCMCVCVAHVHASMCVCGVQACVVCVYAHAHPSMCGIHVWFVWSMCTCGWGVREWGNKRQLTQDEWNIPAVFSTCQSTGLTHSKSANISQPQPTHEHKVNTVQVLTFP